MGECNCAHGLFPNSLIPRGLSFLLLLFLLLLGFGSPATQTG